MNKYYNNFISHEEASSILEPQFEKLSNCYSMALLAFNQVQGQGNGTLNKRTKATLFHNFLINEVKRQFNDSIGVKLIETYETLQIVFSGKLVARFKKLNEGGLPSNIRTRRNDTIVYQQLRLPLPNFYEMTCIDIGYIINSTWSDFKSIRIICRNGSNILWDLILHLQNFQYNSENTVNIEGSDVEGRRRVRVKDHGEEKQEAV